MTAIKAPLLRESRSTGAGKVMRTLVAERNWSGTSLGAIDTWPLSLRAVVNAILDQPLPMIVAWGPELLQIYNDAFREILMEKHPTALGQPVFECWKELMPQLGDTYDRVLSGESILIVDAPLNILRRGYLEEATFTVSYGPLTDDENQICGLLKVAEETTSRVTTERERTRLLAEQSLAVEHSRRSIAAARVGLWHMDPATKQVFWDEQLRAIFQVGQGTLLYEDVLARVHPADRHKLEDSVRQALDPENARPYIVEYRFQHPDGGLRWMQSRGRAIIEDSPEGKRVVALCGAAMDVTERKTAERHLQVIAEMSATVNALSDPREIISAAAAAVGRHLEAQQCFCFERLPGRGSFVVTGAWHRAAVAPLVGEYRMEEFGTRAWWDALQQSGRVVKDVDAEPGICASAYRERGVRAFVTVPFVRDGQWIAGLTVTSDTRGAWDECEVKVIEAVLARMWPLVERGRLLNQLRANHEMLSRQRDLLEKIIADAPLYEILETLTADIENGSGREAIATVMLADAGGNFLYPAAGNRAPPAWLDAVEQVPIGKEEGSCGTAAYRNERVMVSDVASDPLWSKYATEALRLGLRACWSSPINSAQGRVLGCFAVYYREPGLPTDGELAAMEVVTRTAAIAIERERARETLRESQSQLAQHSEKLEQTVRERTTKLQETVSELESFSYSISHDLRAPLRAMQTFARIVEEENGERLQPESREHLRRIITAAERMDRLIQDLLIYSRTAQTNLKLEPVDLAYLLNDILSTYPQFSPPAATIVVTLPFPPVLANVAALTQGLSNLLDNAVKFTRPGVPPEVHVWSETFGSKTKVYIKDNGIGIPKPLHEKIFELFTQIDPARGGTGNGLAVVRKAIERMGGSVGLQSKPGPGSTFYIELNVALS